MVLVIDNYDSFTWNLVHYLQILGAEVKVYRNDAISLSEVADQAPEHILISPGPCTPDEAGISLRLIERFAGKIPILGVCLGHQAIGQALGARVVRAEKPMHGKTSLIYHQDQGVFAGLQHPLQVTRYHSLVLEPGSLPAGLEITAWTGSESQCAEVMGIRDAGTGVQGVQFHPESILSEQGLELLANFLGVPWMQGQAIRQGEE
jgi:para-aminobenzoate synthetase component II